jgi:hypothetical protein
MFTWLACDLLSTQKKLFNTPTEPSPPQVTLLQSLMAPQVLVSRGPLEFHQGGCNYSWSVKSSGTHGWQISETPPIPEVLSPLWCSWDLHSSRMLHSILISILPTLRGQRIDPIFKGQTAQEEWGDPLKDQMCMWGRDRIRRHSFRVCYITEPCLIHRHRSIPLLVIYWNTCPDMSKPTSYYITPTLQHDTGFTMVYGTLTQFPFLDFASIYIYTQGVSRL